MFAYKGRISRGWADAPPSSMSPTPLPPLILRQINQKMMKVMYLVVLISIFCVDKGIIVISDLEYSAYIFLL